MTTPDPHQLTLQRSPTPIESGRGCDKKLEQDACSGERGGLAGQGPNGKEPEPCPRSQSRLNGSVTGQKGGNDYQGVRPRCFQMAQPGGKRRPALGEHEHRRGMKGTDSPGMRGHDPQTRPTASSGLPWQPQERWLADSARHQKHASPSRATAGKKKLQNIHEWYGNQNESRSAKSMRRRWRRREPANYGWRSRGEQRPRKSLSAKAPRETGLVSMNHTWLLCEGSIAWLDHEEVVVWSKPSRFLSLRKRCHWQPVSPKAKYAATDRKGSRAPGHTCFVPSRATRQTLLLPLVCALVARTDLKHDNGNTEDCLCNWVQLTGVNVFLVLYGWVTTDLCDDSTIFNRLVH